MIMQTKKDVQKTTPFHVGKWLPSDQAILEKWMSNLIEEVKINERPLLPVIEDFKNLIEGDPEIYMQFNLMFEQVPHKPPYNKDPTGKPQVRSYQHMLQLLNKIMTKAPEFDTTCFVGLPFCAIFGWPMGTSAGSAAFLNDKVNRQLKKILNEWAIFLSSEDSRYVLNSNPHKGWFGKDAQVAIPNLAETYKCNLELPY